MTTLAIGFRSLLIRKNSRNGLWLLPLLLSVVLAAVLAARSDVFGQRQNLTNLTAQATPLLLASLGQLMVVLIGGIDLSIGAVVSLSTAILVIDAPPYVVIPAVFCAAALVGLVNGLTVAKLKVHPIIATLSTMGVVQGVTLILRPVAGGIVPGVINHSVTSDFLGLPMPLFWSLAALLTGWKLVHASRYGLHLFAVGGGKDFASSYGINVNRVSVNAYILSSLFAAAAGIFLAARIASGDPKVGDLFAIDSITAVALGGVQLAGGIGSVAGAAAGSVLLALLANGMNLENLSAYIQTGIRGVILLSVIALQPRKNIGL